MKKVHQSAVVLMGIVFLMTILFGPAFCGWVCPFGSFQEWLAKIGKRIFKKSHNRMIPA